jgi:hypothetical protein
LLRHAKLEKKEVSIFINESANKYKTNDVRKEKIQKKEDRV